MRRKFADICSDLITRDEKSVIMLGDISHFLLRDTEAKAPERFFNIGICEQSMVSMASGMAMEGLRPIIHTIAPFLVERAYEQIKVDLGYQNTDVTIVTVGGTYDYSDLGCTHHCYNDIALMRSIPNMQVYEPGSPKEFEQLFNQTWNNGSPRYFRLSGHSHNYDLDVTSGKINIVRESKNGKWVFVCGHLLDDVMEAKDHGVFYVPTLSHMTNESLQSVRDMIMDSDRLYSVENHFKIGGLGDFIQSYVGTKIKRIGLEPKFITSYGSYDDLRTEALMDRKNILRQLQ